MAVAAGGSVGCGGNLCLQRRDHPSNQVIGGRRRACSLMASNQLSLKPRTTKIMASASALQPLQKKQKEERKRDELLHEKIDAWMRDSVVEIVKKLPESPLLVHVYSDDNKTRTTTEKAVEDNWVLVKQKWEKGEAPMPDGVIFVEQLQDEEEGEQSEEQRKNEAVSRAWGIVVQGKGEGFGPPTCYLLKTSKVCSGFGLKCTHFCLVKVKNFRETAFSQLKNCWLLQGN